jgi:hypothetical protein
MAASPTRRGMLGGIGATGATLALGAPASWWLTFERRSRHVLIVDEGAFDSGPGPLGVTLAAQGFGVHPVDFAEEGIDLSSVRDFDAVILGPRLSRQDRAWLELAFRMAKIPTPMLTA